MKSFCCPTNVYEIISPENLCEDFVPVIKCQNRLCKEKCDFYNIKSNKKGRDIFGKMI